MSQWGDVVGCLTFQQHASVIQAQICSDNFTCCLAEIEVADLTFYLTQSQYTDNLSQRWAYNARRQSSHLKANF